MFKSRQGFTLIELIVVLAIFGIITAIVIGNAPDFRDKTAFDLVSQKIALNIREAQVYGIGTSHIGNITPPSFGVHFNSSELSRFLLFADKGGDDKYTSSEFGPCNDNTEECLNIHTLSGARIQKICVETTPTSGCEEPAPNLVDIYYTRPSSEANFCLRVDYNSNCRSASKVIVTIESRNGSRKKDIIIWRSGQIEVKDVSI